MQLPNETLQGFQITLRNSSLSDKTIRNYLSDLSHFSTWVATLVGTTNFIPYLSSTIVEKYKSSMSESGAPIRTINRRLSTIRLFGKYLHEQGVLPTNPAGNLSNLDLPEENEHEQLLSEFKKHLEEQKVSEKTMRNYVSDVRSFLSFSIEYQRRAKG